MNYYNNYPYQYQYPQYYQPPQQQQQSMPTLNGKIVDSVEVARATEVPIGGYGVFPKADLSELYIKSWNNNGTTSLTVYKPAEVGSEAPEIGFPQIIEQLNILQAKIDNLTQPAVVPSKKKEVKVNEY